MGLISLFNIIGNGTRTILSFLAVILATRWLGLKTWGEISLILAYTSFLHYLLSFGMDQGMVVFGQSYLPEKKNKLFQINLINIFISIGLTLLATFIFYLIFSFFPAAIKISNEIKPDFLVYVLIMGFGAIGAIISGYLRAKKQLVSILVKEQFLAPIILLISLCFFKFNGDTSINAYHISFWASTIIPVIFIAYFFFKDASFLSFFKKARFQESLSSLKLSTPIGFAITIELLIYSLTLIILNNFSTKEDIGFFSIVLRLSTILLFFPKSILPIFSPYIAESFYKKDIKRFKNILKKVSTLNLQWAFLVFTLLAIYQSTILLVFGVEDNSRSTIYLVLTLALAIEGAFSSLKTTLINLNKGGLEFKLQLFAVLFLVFLGIPLSKHFGALGMATTFLVQLVISYLVRFLILKKTIDDFSLKLFINKRSLIYITISLLYLFLSSALPYRDVYLLFIGALVFIPFFLKEKDFFLKR